jgi:hypothetical protein
MLVGTYQAVLGVPTRTFQRVFPRTWPGEVTYGKILRQVRLGIINPT